MSARSGGSTAAASSGTYEQDAAYSEAYACASSLVERHGLRKAAAIATETLGVPISASTHLAGGMQPRSGKVLTIPKEIEDKLEDRCIV